MTVPRPWAPATRPTAAQLLTWLRDPGHTPDDDDALLLVDRLLTDHDTAHRCLVMDHDSLAAELNRLRPDATRWAILREHVHTTTPGEGHAVTAKVLDLLHTESDTTP